MGKWLKVSLWVFAMCGIVRTVGTCFSADAQHLSDSNNSGKKQFQAFFANSAAIESAIPQPNTQKIPVLDTYHGVTVADDYRWLENGGDPKVKAWVGSWGDYGRGFERTNLTRMIKFAEAFPDGAIVATLSHQLSWSHFRELLPLDKPLQREFYAEMCGMEG